MKEKTNFKDFTHVLLDKFLQFNLYAWGFVFFVMFLVLIFTFFSDFQNIPTTIVIALGVISIGLFFMTITREQREFMETTSENIDKICEKLNIKAKPYTKLQKRSYRDRLVEDWVDNGLTFEEVRRIYIDAFGLKRWVMEGRAVAEYSIRLRKKQQ